ncbi:MAG: hypothetical protein SFX73_19335 [Kofleriaceae bacterium]|nr:hypothetical protein [Kofleriaceae bacterium]
MRRSTVILGILGMLAVPTETSAQPPRAPAPEENPDPYALTRNPVFKAGAITFLASYGLTIGFAAGSLDEDNRWLYIPLAGPWITLADTNDGEGNNGDRWLLAFDGIAQAAGVAMVATAYFQNRRARYINKRFTRLAVTPRSISVAGTF